jgi:hypothetical protein
MFGQFFQRFLVVWQDFLVALRDWFAAFWA